MKKCVALVIACSFLMSAVSCKKAEPSETAPSETVSTSSETIPTSSETIVTSTSETTEEPSSDTEAPTSGITLPSRRGDPSWQLTPMESITINPCRKLDFTNTPTYHRYSVKDPKGGQDFVVSCRYSTITINEPGYEELQKVLDEIANRNATLVEEHYKQSALELAEASSSGKELKDAFYDSIIFTGRADEHIVSVSYSFRDNDADYETHRYNIDSKSGKILTLDDVVKDKEALCKYIENTIYDAYVYRATSYDYLTEYMDKIFPSIMDGTIEFGMRYDGIYFGDVAVSAVNCPDCFNMDYFLNVPENYEIRSDSSNTISWDIDGDGKVETISMSVSKSGDRECTLHIGEVTQKVDIEHSEYIFMLIHTSTGFVLDFGASSGSDSRCEVIYRINDDRSLEFLITGCDTFEENLIDSDLPIMESEDQHYAGNLFGIADPFNSYYTITGEKIKIDKQEWIFNGPIGGYYLKTDVKCRIQKDDGKWEKDTLPTGTGILIIGYDISTKELILEDMHPDYTENRRIKVSYSASDKTIDNVSAYDVLDTISIGGG
ncbi:MAG: hypothetical protein IK106_05100 [Clostridiales bacterium]|nr:hypothetical protein [Clostridiales bacterium]